MPKLYDHPNVTQTYFFPQPAEPLPTTEHARPVALRLADGTGIGGYWAKPIPGAPTLLYLHGNGEAISHQLPQWPRWCEDAGINSFYVDFPGYASSDGVPTFTSCARAAQAALDFLLAQSEDEVPRLIIAGRSVGSIFALDAAAHCRSQRLAGLMLESGVADLKQRLAMRVPYGQLGLDEATVNSELERDFDHRSKLASLSCPVMVLHTKNDSLVPAWHGEKLARWAGENLFRLVLFEGGDHNTIHFHNEASYRQQLSDFVQLVCGDRHAT